MRFSKRLFTIMRCMIDAISSKSTKGHMNLTVNGHVKTDIILASSGIAKCVLEQNIS